MILTENGAVRLSSSLALCFMLASCRLMQASEIKVITAAGDLAPNLGMPFRSLSAPVINTHGNVAFYGQVSLSQNDGIWQYRPGLGLTSVATVGDPAPGLGPHAVFESFFSVGNGGNNRTSNLSLTDSGRSAFAAASSAGRALWALNPDGSLTLIAKDGDSAPGTTYDFAMIANRVPAVNERGDIAFHSRTTASGTRNGAVHQYSAATGAINFVARDRQ